MLSPVPQTVFESLKTGDLLFFSGSRLWSRLIRWRTRSMWSHVGVAVWIDGALFVLEALEGDGVRLAPISVWLGWRGRIGLGRVAYGSTQQRLAAKSSGLAQLTSRYASPRQFVRSFSVVYSKLARHWRLSEDGDASRWFCSELAATLLSVGGFVLPKRPAELSPGDCSELAFVDVYLIWNTLAGGLDPITEGS